MRKCILCRIRKVAWWLTGYYGFGTVRTGIGTRNESVPCCHKCYHRSVSHDAFGQPHHPRLYKLALIKYQKRCSVLGA